MRNELYPARLAVYEPRYTSPKPPQRLRNTELQGSSAEIAVQRRREMQKKVPKIDFANVHAQLSGITTIKFMRKVLAEHDPAAGTEATADDNPQQQHQAIYGSVTKSDIAIVLRDQHSLPVDKEWVQLDAKIKRLGEYECTVTLPDLEPVQLKIEVVAY
ncbi:hypothetical protein EV182_001180 [Spiromyces aspiralis]|uniref:Uncharacterized protein n=1 Tax=Spiromyces aspiralis TaxID=68401 RepID=A0ACC1HIK4_9FUNG|nr:hypothetical protein EV182_001180 [Spiromyces aspiralis]